MTQVFVAIHVLVALVVEEMLLQAVDQMAEIVRQDAGYTQLMLPFRLRVTRICVDAANNARTSVLVVIKWDQEADVLVALISATVATF